MHVFQLPTSVLIALTTEHPFHGNQTDLCHKDACVLTGGSVLPAFNKHQLLVPSLRMTSRVTFPHGGSRYE